MFNDFPHLGRGAAGGILSHFKLALLRGRVLKSWQGDRATGIEELGRHWRLVQQTVTLDRAEQRGREGGRGKYRMRKRRKKENLYACGNVAISNP